jgi:gluconolactonase
VGKSSLSFYAAVAIHGFAAFAVRAQVTLPPDLAGPSATVTGVLNRDPVENRFLGYCEGPAADASGNLFFTEKGDESGDRTGPNIIWKVPPQGPATRFYGSREGTNGLEFDPLGRLVAMQIGKVRRFTPDGKTEVLDSSYVYGKLNDLSINSKGEMYVTNLSGGSVFRLSADGKTRQEFKFYGPNGVEWIEEKGVVYLNGGGGVQRLTVASNGSLINPVTLKQVDAADGITVDERGNVYVASWGDGAVYVIDSTGKDLGSITVASADTTDQDQSGNVSNCGFGGPDNKTLYITGDGGAYEVRLKVAGRKRPASSGAVFSGALDRKSKRRFVRSATPVFTLPGPSDSRSDARGRVESIRR